MDPSKTHLHLGIWKRSIPYVDSVFASDKLDEPHIKRRLAILKKHPEIIHLYGRNLNTVWILLVAMSVHFLTTYILCKSSISTSIPTWLYLLVALVIGATITQVSGLVIHEASHNLIFKSPFLNKLFLFVANIPLCFPIGASFRRYHLEHHAYQGVQGLDPDLPIELEYKLIKGNPIAKFIWLLIYPFMYVVRGAALRRRMSSLEILNVFTVIITQYAIYSFLGRTKALIYMAISFWLGYSVHPAAAHFIQEHFTWKDGQETYSYYGALNKIFLNIGYHNEHHDFTQIPWSRLPAITNIAPEFYSPLTSHQSWMYVFWEFIFDTSLGPQSRVERTLDAHIQGRSEIIAK